MKKYSQEELAASPTAVKDMLRNILMNEFGASRGEIQKLLAGVVFDQVKKASEKAERSTAEHLDQLFAGQMIEKLVDKAVNDALKRAFNATTDEAVRTTLKQAIKDQSEELVRRRIRIDIRDDDPLAGAF